MLITINKYISEIDVNHIKNYKEKKNQWKKNNSRRLLLYMH